MTRSEISALSIAGIGHLVLFGILSVGFLATPNPDRLRSVPIEVALVDEVGLESLSPNPTTEEPAARLSPVEAPIEPEPAPEPVTQPEPATRPQPVPPKPAPAPDGREVEKSARPSSGAPAARSNSNRKVERTGRLDGIVDGLTDRPSRSKSTTPPASKAGPVSQASLAAEIRRQILPHWQPLGGLDARDIQTFVRIRIAKSGVLIGDPQIVDQKNVNANNRGPASILRQRALAAVKAAIPIDTSRLPEEHYSAWRDVTLVLDRRK